jgi:hypothetical protein
VVPRFDDGHVAERGKQVGHRRAVGTEAMDAHDERFPSRWSGEERGDHRPAMTVPAPFGVHTGQP